VNGGERPAEPEDGRCSVSGREWVAGCPGVAGGGAAGSHMFPFSLVYLIVTDVCLGDFILKRLAFSVSRN